MKRLEMGSRLLEGILDKPKITYDNFEFPGTLDKVTEREKFRAAKQILFGIGILYIFTISAALIRPDEGQKLVDIITISFPPIVTLILAAYFRDKPA